MIRFSALGARFSLPLPALLIPFIAARLGLRGSLGGAFLALGLHELGHLLAARLARVDIREIQLMPFGGSARMENPYRLSGRQLAAVAAAGPAVNLLCALGGAALAHWGLIDARAALRLTRPNLMLMLFNLLPALPLDGGRLLYAATRARLGDARALRLGLISGRALAALLSATALYAGLARGRWNLTLLLAAIFILCSEADERTALSQARLRNLSQALNAPKRARPLVFYELDAATPAARALRLLRARESVCFSLVKNGAPGETLDARILLSFLLEGGAPETPLSALVDAPRQ